MHRQTRSRRASVTSRRWPQGPLAAGLAPVVSLASGSAAALVINASYDTSVDSAPAGFKTAFQSIVNFFRTPSPTRSPSISGSVGERSPGIRSLPVRLAKARPIWRAFTTTAKFAMR
jgi:hypothetical protein